MKPSAARADSVDCFGSKTVIPSRMYFIIIQTGITVLKSALGARKNDILVPLATKFRKISGLGQGIIPKQTKKFLRGEDLNSVFSLSCKRFQTDYNPALELREILAQHAQAF